MIFSCSPIVPWWNLAMIGVLNALGFIIFRAAENQRCEMTQNPNSTYARQLQNIPAVGGKKILCAGWWGVVRNPNYLGEILIQWSWVSVSYTHLTLPRYSLCRSRWSPYH